MRSVNITGNKLHNLSTVQEPVDVLLIHGLLVSYAFFPQQNLNVSPQLMMQLWRGRTAEQNLLQVNGLYFPQAGTNSHSETVALTPSDSPIVCSSIYERAGFFCYSFLLCFLIVHCAVRERLMYLQTKSSLMVFALAELCTLVLYAALNKTWIATSWNGILFQFQSRLQNISVSMFA